MGFNSINNNVNTVSLARTYWGIPSSSFEIGGNTTLLRPTASGVRGMVLTPFSQDSDGIPQYVLARCMVFLQGKHSLVVGYTFLLSTRRILLMKKTEFNLQTIKFKVFPFCRRPIFTFLWFDVFFDWVLGVLFIKFILLRFNGKIVKIL